MHDFVDDLRRYSQLDCQIRMTPGVDEISVRVPPLAV